MDVTTITVADFKGYFTRDFPYLPPNVTPQTEGYLNYVLDSDITKAFGQAQILFNTALFDDDPSEEIGYLFLTAHYLCVDLRIAQQGVQSKPDQTVTGRTVGSVSEQYAIPDRIKESIILNPLMQTGYGQKYLSLIAGNLIGNVTTVAGWTTPW